jgi:hypothetical protein
VFPTGEQQIWQALLQTQTQKPRQLLRKRKMLVLIVKKTLPQLLQEHQILELLRRLRMVWFHRN